MTRFLWLALVCTFVLPAQSVKVVVLSESVYNDLRAAGDLPPQVQLVPATPQTLAKEIVDADALITLDRISEDNIRAAKKLRWIQSYGAGVEKILDWKEGQNSLRDGKIIMTNNQIVQGPEIADHAMAMLLAHTRQLPKYIANREKGVWQGGNQGFVELKDKTAVVIGVGGIGSNIAVRAWAHGMKVIGVDPDDMPFSPIVQRYVKPDQLDEVLPLADVVFVSAPDTEMSHKMMGAKQFELLKPNSYFIAVSRGGVYDLNALVKALDSKKLAGAGVDVTDPEPLPAGHALWKFNNVIITPHVSGRSDKDRARMLATITENLKRFAAGKPLINQIDPRKGY
jgi:D-2-hydroxyacid dehydrogenase (NADP+)